MFSVLYVDDEEGLLQLGKIFLERSGSLRVETALSAKEAIDILGTTPIDCILSDYQMPEMDGITFLKYIRVHFKQLPFILFTGKGREEVVIEALNSGADYYLQKGGSPKSQFVELEHKIRLAIERRRTADELSESRQWMKDIIDHLPDATFAIDLNGTVIAWNRAMEEMTGIKIDEILGTGNHSYAIPFYGERRPILLDLVLKDDPITENKYPRITRKDNKLISEIYIPLLYGGKGAYLWFVASPLYDIRGNIIGAIESIRDITERRNAEEALRKSEERYRAVVEDQTEFISRFLPDGTHIFVNEAYCRYFNIPREYIIGKKFIPGIPKKDQRLVKEHFASLTREKSTAIITHRIIMPDGSVRWQRWSDRAIFNEQGNLIEYQSVGRDFTELKLAEEELRDSKDRLNAIVRGSPIPQFVIDRNHRVIYWNDALEKNSGIKGEGIIGTNQQWRAFYDKERPCMADLLVDNEIEKIPQWYEGKYAKSKLIDGGYEAVDFFPRMGQSGTWLFFTAAPIRNSDGSVIGAVETLEDITERKRAEEALRQANRQLNLLGSITRHDILNKVTIILGYISIVKERISDPILGQYIKDLETATNAIQSQIKFTGVYKELGSHGPRWQELDIILPRSHVPPTMTLTAHVKGIEVYADPMLEHVFFNLLDNSIRHGERVTEIRVSFNHSDERLIVVWEDNGVGIATEEKEKIFERGFGKNTGLGLFLVHEVLSMAGITITETGVQGIGARFEIIVPKGMYRFFEIDEQ